MLLVVGKASYSGIDSVDDVSQPTSSTHTQEKGCQTEGDAETPNRDYEGKLRQCQERLECSEADVQRLNSQLESTIYERDRLEQELVLTKAVSFLTLVT